MPRRATLFRIAYRLLLGEFGIFALLVFWIHLESWCFRYRAGRLIKDFQSIRLHQSTWGDAQALMHRWGAWGHYDGVCNATNCKYRITLEDLASGFLVYRGDDPPPLNWLMRPFLLVSEPLGGRFGGLQVGFIVQDGLIWRANTILDIHAPRKHFFPRENDVDGDLVLVAQSRQSLRDESPNTHWILGGNEQLAEHPTYKVGRPGGCESCLMAEVTYSLNAAPEDIARFTNYDLSCFTTKNCQILEDVLPAAKEWHLYDPPWGLPESHTASPQAGPTPCQTPMSALGRDATAVIAVDVLSVSQVNRQSTFDNHEFSYELDQVRLVQGLKGSLPWPIRSDLSVSPYRDDFASTPSESAEHLTPNKRFLLVVFGVPQDKRNMTSAGHDGEDFTQPLDRCGVLPDTPVNRAELAKGFQWNDQMRVPEF